MNLEVRVYGGLEKRIPGASFGKPIAVPLKPKITVRDVLMHLKIPEEEVFTILVNGVHAQLEKPLSSGDRVAFFPPVGGG